MQARCDCCAAVLTPAAARMHCFTNCWNCACSAACCPTCAAREQENNSKHLQMVSGAPPTAFWLANFCWDCLNFALPAAGIVALVWWYNVPQLAGPRLVAMALLLGGTGPAGITCTYLCHFFFRVRRGRTLAAPLCTVLEHG